VAAWSTWANEKTDERPGRAGASSTVHAIETAFVGRDRRRLSGASEPATTETDGIEVVRWTTTRGPRKESTPMSAHPKPILQPDATDALPAVLVVLMAILAMLGIVAHAAVL
jgi:hypothetical protein